MRTRTYRMSFEVERGSRTVEYEAEFRVTPGEPDHYDRSIGGPGGWSPGCGPEITDVSVFFVTKDRKTGKKVRELRPELEALVSEEELLATAAEDEADARDAYDEDRADELRERRLLGD